MKTRRRKVSAGSPRSLVVTIPTVPPGEVDDRRRAHARAMMLAIRRAAESRPGRDAELVLEIAWRQSDERIVVQIPTGLSVALDAARGVLEGIVPAKWITAR